MTSVLAEFAARVRVRIGQGLMSAWVTVPRAEGMPVTAAEILEALKRHGVCHGIDSQAVAEAASLASEKPVEVARGTPPQPGTNGYVELLIPEGAEIEEAPPEEACRVDWRWRAKVVEVRQGDRLAVLHPPVEGVPGMNVIGKPLPPPLVKPALLRAGEGVTLTSDGMTAHAERSGLPVVMRHDRTVSLKVLPVLVHRGNIDLETGNRKFQGAIHIIGNVCRGGEVQAGETAIIDGHVDFGRVVARGTVVISGKVFGSHVSAGVNEEAEPMLALLESFCEAFRQLYERGAPGHLAVTALLEKNFSGLACSLEQPSGVLTECREWVDQARRLLFPAAPGLDLHQLRWLVDQFRAQVSNESANVRVTYAQNTKVVAGGDIVITQGQGVFYSNLRAGGTVEIRGKMRASTLEASGNVYVEEVGSKRTESACLISVPREAEVTLGRAYPGTIVSIGGVTWEVEGGIFAGRLRFSAEKNAVEVF